MTFQGGQQPHFQAFPLSQFLIALQAIKIWTVRRLAKKAGWSAGTSK